MFLGELPGLHDRILDVSTAVTGATFFVPPLRLLEALGDAALIRGAREPPRGPRPSADSKGTAL